ERDTRSSSGKTRPTSLGPQPKSAKCFLETRVVTDAGEVVVLTGLLPEGREQLDGPLEVPERLVGGVTGEGRETRVVVVKARVLRHLLEAVADRVERVAIALLAVGGHRFAVERPRLTPVERSVRLALGRADGKDGSFPGCLPARVRPHEHVRPRGCVERLAVDLEGRVPVEHDVQLLL